MESAKWFHISLNRPNSKIINKIFIYIMVLLGAFYLGLKSFLIFHTAVEIACIIIAYTMAVISINTHSMNNDNRIIFLGVAYGFIAFFDLIHIFAFKGMSFFLADSSNLPTQLWVIARYMESISLLIICIFPNKQFKLRRMIPIYLTVSIILLLSIFVWDIFPQCFSEELGLTRFKIISEYIICSILLIGMLYVIKNNQDKSKKTTVLVFFSLLTTLVSEICFTWYSGIYDTVMIIGHIFKLISFYFVYISLAETSLKNPYYALDETNRILNIRNRELENLIEQLKQECEIRQKIETENVRKNEILNTILETSLNGILVKGNDKKIIHINNKLLEILDISYEMLLDKEDSFITDLLVKQLTNFEEVKKIMNKGWNMQYDSPYYLHFKDGRTIEIMSSPFLDKGISLGKILIFRDITERKIIEDLEKKVQIRQALLEKAKEYDEMKNVFFSTVSHEFKTPLNIILGSIQMLEKIYNNHAQASIYEKFGKYVKMMKQNCNRLLKLVNNIVDITRIDSGFLQINMKNENIVSVIEDITQSVAEYSNSMGISLTFDTDIEEKIIACDADKIERVILNLLSNALKFTEASGSIIVHIKDKNNKILVSVKDTGIGIPENMTKKIFDRFRQVDTSLRRKKEGSGIGLSIVKSIVELHGGSVRVHSEVDKGSEFIIELPVNQIDDDEHNEISTPREINVERINIEFSDIYM